MAKAAVVYDTETKRPLMVVADATDSQLAEHSHNPPGCAQVVIDMDEYNELTLAEFLAMIPK